MVLSTTAAVAYTGSMIVLDKAWYSGFDRGPFHFFNDAAEWKQLDKAGHFYSAFYLSATSTAGLKYCNVSASKADWIGALSGFAVLSSIELFDARSAAYGASVSDLAANFSGSLLFWGQQRAWHEVRIRPKYSFHTTAFAAQRPSVLGDGAEEFLKDYNGQTYWLSWNPGRFLHNSRWPKWLDISMGYGAEQMISARDEQNAAVGLQPFRQYYLSIDFNSDALPVRSKFLKGLLSITKIIKVPAPTLEFSTNGVRLHALYF